MKIKPLRIVNRVERFIRPLSFKNYDSAKAYYHFYLYLSNIGKKDPLLVYQMGKVGSTTILRSLRALRLDMPIYHIHFLGQDYIDRNDKDERRNYSPENVGRCTHLWRSQYLRKQINKSLKKKKWKIVTLTRDPLARNISAFFEDADYKVERSDSVHQYKIKSGYGFEKTINIEDIEDLIELYFEKFEHDAPLTFFNRELKGVFGVDVYSSEFPKSKGYKIYNEEHADVLLIKLEKLNECANEAFKEFLDIDEFNLIRANISTKKIYYPLYKRLLDSIVLPDTYFNQMYESKYARHFYSDREINEFKVKWHKK